MLHLIAFAVLAFGSIAYGGVLPRGLVPVSDGRIYGGKEAKLGQFPYQASMRYFGLHRCGASIYRHDAVLLAAHCTHELPADLMEIAMGTIYRNRGGEERWIRLIIQHKDFEPETYKNDIAIIIMERSVDFSDTIQPIPLASIGEDLKAGTLATVTGWGIMNDEGHLPDIFHYVKIRIVDHAECVQVYKDLNPVEDHMLCAGEPEGGKDACGGDSGGPLVVENKLYGIVSWGDDCAKPGVPGVYTSVAAFRSWIKSQYE